MLIHTKCNIIVHMFHHCQAVLLPKNDTHLESEWSLLLQGCKVVKGSVKTSAASSPAPSPAPSPGLVSSPPPLQQRPRGRTWSSPLSTVHNGDCARPPAVRYVSRSVDPSRVSGQLLSLPSGVTSRLNLGQPLQLKLGGQTFIVPPSCFISGPDGVKVLLPAGSLSSRVRPTDIQVQTVANGLRGGTTGATGGGGGEEGVGGNPAEPAAHSPDPVVSVEPVKPAATAVPPPEDQVEVRKRSDRGGGVDPTCHFHKLHFGFSCMINIFQHLSVADLLRSVSSAVSCSAQHSLRTPFSALLHFHKFIG